MTQKPTKNGDKVAADNNFTEEEQTKLKEYYEMLNKNLELG